MADGNGRRGDEHTGQRRTIGHRGVLALVVAVTAMLTLWWPSSAGAKGVTCTGYAPTPMTVTPNPVASGGSITVAGVASPTRR